jgi:excisionase family DNA binding protein
MEALGEEIPGLRRRLPTVLVMEARMMSVAEAADFLGLTTQTVQRMARRGELRGRKLARRWRFKPEELLRVVTPPETKVRASSAMDIVRSSKNPNQRS